MCWLNFIEYKEKEREREESEIYFLNTHIYKHTKHCFVVNFFFLFFFRRVCKNTEIEFHWLFEFSQLEISLIQFNLFSSFLPAPSFFLRSLLFIIIDRRLSLTTKLWIMLILTNIWSLIWCKKRKKRETMIYFLIN